MCGGGIADDPPGRYVEPDRVSIPDRLPPEGGTMKHAGLVLFALLIAGCNEIPPSGPLHESTLIIVNVHWQSQGVADIPVVIVQTGDSVRTDTNGLAVFSVVPGQYVVRAYGINRGGPVVRSIDFDVDATRGEAAVVDIIDCLPCV